MAVITTYNCTRLTGGADRALDSISVANLADGDRAIVADSNNNFRYFEFQASATDAEDTSNTPARVRPDDYSSSGVWYEQVPNMTKADVGLGNVENTALSTWNGSTTITTVGAITAGSWGASAISNDYIAGIDQNLLKTSVPKFGGVDLNGIGSAAVRFFSNDELKAYIQGMIDAETGGRLIFHVETTDGWLREVMRITSAGSVGIGLVPTANMLGLSIEDGILTLKETTTPTADADYGKIYTKSDNKLYFQDGAGTEHEIAFV